MIYLTAKGQKQGDFKGDVTKATKGLTDKMIVVHAFDYGVKCPIDISSGQHTGKRQHKPVTITKNPGPSSINFLTAACQNEMLPTVKVDFMMPEGTDLKPQYTVELANVSVIGYNLESHEETEYSGGESSGGTSTGGGGSMQTAHEVRLERIELAFQKITVTWTKGGITFTDDWQAIN
ncbi:MAG TPA: type VI secretion system tube protein TssD [Steroidobacteraceae bacterium]|nr:type VI secretion system tube protein TssD [Steroidobacteraceae bacterium]